MLIIFFQICPWLEIELVSQYVKLSMVYTEMYIIFSIDDTYLDTYFIHTLNFTSTWRTWSVHGLTQQ